jgi:hypothetical protein
MNTNQPGNQDEALRKVLKEWRTDAALPPRFQEGVWSRIERTQAPATRSVWTFMVHWISTMLPRPALAASYVVLLLMVGATVGWTHARQDNARMKSELGQRYVRVLDPYQAPRE